MGVSPAKDKAAETSATMINVPRDDEPIIPDRMPYIVIIITS